MLAKINQYFQQLLSKKSLRLKNSVSFCCLTIMPKKIMLAYFKEGEIQFCESIAYEGTEWVHALTEMVYTHHLNGMNCSLVLQPSDYQLLMTEALPVPEGEFQSAIRWKIKDLLPYPIEDAVIDHFLLPPTKMTSSAKMMMVVASRLSVLTKTAEGIKEAGLKLSVIDIPELAFRNVVSLFEDDEKSVAFIYLREKQSELIITRQKTFFFSRRLELDVYSTQQSAQWETLVLEIQRSLDYYQSQWRNPSPMRLLVAAVLNGPTMNVTDFLTQKLFVPAEALDLTPVLKSRRSLSLEQQGEYLPVIGGGLRDWVV